jgi:hypothetical protein
MRSPERAGLNRERAFLEVLLLEGEFTHARLSCAGLRKTPSENGCPRFTDRTQPSRSLPRCTSPQWGHHSYGGSRWTPLRFAPADEIPCFHGPATIERVFG